MHRDIVVIGGGHAAAQFCVGMAEAGWGSRVLLLGEESEVPYQRPPLSKSFLKTPDEAPQPIRGADWYAQADIEVRLGCRAEAIDREARQVHLADGSRVPYAWVVLATGTRARQLPDVPSGLSNVMHLRTAADATRLRHRLADAQRIVVLGGGFIGLEIACTASALGRQVTVLEAAPRLLSRSLSPAMAEHVLRTHRAAGVDIRLNTRATGFDIGADALHAIQLGDERLELDLLVVGIGAVPETTLAQNAGLACSDGVMVDAHMRSADPHILAIGDCARFPRPQRQQPDAPVTQHLRLESIQNANDQARTAVSTVLGQLQPYAALPWFWSEQGSMRLQMAGCMPEGSSSHRRPGARDDAFSILHYDQAGRLACIESLNAAPDHMAAKKLLDLSLSPPPATACDPAIPLRSLC